MIRKLKNIFPSLLHYKKSPDEKPAGYNWFLTPEEEFIAIDTKEISKRDLILISTFLIPWQENLPLPTKKELQWMDYIKEQRTLEDNVKYRFIYFKIQGKDINTIETNDDIKAALNKTVNILWQNNNEGIIIEVVESYDSKIRFEEIIDVLMSDLYLNINLYIGPFKNNNDSPKNYYKTFKKRADYIFKNTNRPVVTFEESLPRIIISQMDDSLEKEIVDNVLGQFKEDREWLKAMDVFFNADLNVTVASKELFMHRNTFQYELDKFTENTGLDIRQFNHAVLVQLALKILNS